MAASELQVEIDKRNPFDSLEQEAYLNLARTLGFLSQEFDRLFQRYGLSAPQYNVLRILRGRGGDGVSCLDIARNMVHRTPDITRLGNRLERAGYVTRGRTSEDRRIVLLRLTPTGLDVLARLDEPVQTLHRQLLSHLDADDLRQLNRLLVKARRPLAAQAAGRLPEPAGSYLEPTASCASPPSAVRALRASPSPPAPHASTATAIAKSP